MPMIDGHYHMNALFGKGIEEARKKMEHAHEAGPHRQGGTKKIAEIHAGPNGFAVHVHKESSAPVGNDISSDKAEVHEFPSHEEMAEFVKRLAQETHGSMKGPRGEHAEQQPDEDHDGGDNDGISVPGSAV